MWCTSKCGPRLDVLEVCVFGCRVSGMYLDDVNKVERMVYQSLGPEAHLQRCEHGLTLLPVCGWVCECVVVVSSMECLILRDYTSECGVVCWGC